jgi:glutamate-1-semialdehyde 2,1-aminomutase
MATDITSSRLTDGARRLVPAGVHSNSRIGGGPTYLARGEGAYLWDIAGRRYPDCTMGNGAVVLGDEEIASIAGADAPPERTP